MFQPLAEWLNVVWLEQPGISWFPLRRRRLSVESSELRCPGWSRHASLLCHGTLPILWRFPRENPWSLTSKPDLPFRKCLLGPQTALLLPGLRVRSETLSQQVEISMICIGFLSSVTGCQLPVLCCSSSASPDSLAWTCYRCAPSASSFQTCNSLV